MSLLGIDIGTSGCKAAAFSYGGRQLSFAYREYPTLYNGDKGAELDSRQVFSSVCECVREASCSASADPVKALCVSSMGEAAVPVSRKDGILGDSILSMDMRGGEYVRELMEKIGEEEFYSINANIPSPAYSFPKLAWIREHQQELYSRTEHFVLWDGLLGYLCGCEPFISHSSASRTMLFDLKREDWSGEILGMAGMDRTKLPRCLRSGTVAGHVGKAMTGKLGLPDNVAVVVGAHDQCCNALGAGICRPGSAVDGIGTFECITPVYQGIPDMERMRQCGLNIEHHVVPGLFVSFIFNQAGSLVKWFRRTFASAENDPDIYEKLSAEMPPEPSGLTILPYFEPTGAPGYVSDASGIIAGLRTSSSRGEILKGIMEGVTFYFAQYVNLTKPLGIDCSSFVATGGGAKSDSWLQMKADIMGVPYMRPKVSEAGLAGAAMLAGMGVGEFNSFNEAVEAFVSIERCFEPDPRRHEIYRAKLLEYERLLHEWMKFHAS